MYDSMFENRRKGNAGFLYGLIGGFILICIHITLLIIFKRTNGGDWIAWFVAWPLYFIMAHAAANKQYENQRDTLEPFRNVTGAGVGAALITCVLGGVFVFLRNVFADQIGVFVFILVEPISLCLSIFLSVLIAMGLGAMGGKIVVNKYQIKNDY